MSFQDQTTLNTLRTLQQENTAMIEHPKMHVIPGNKALYPIHSRPASLDLFQDLVERNLTILHNNESDKAMEKTENLPISQQKVLKELARNPHIVVRNADKGGPVVVLDSELYRLQNLNILKDDTTYRILPRLSRLNCRPY